MLNLKMPDINNVIIAGNLTCDPSFRKTTNGTPVANFFLASNRKFKDNSGQWRENVCYVGVVAWYKLAESCFENLKRGSAILVDGELQSRNWRNDDGTSHNVVEIKARRIQFLDKKLSLNTANELSDLDEDSMVKRSAEVEDYEDNIDPTPDNSKSGKMNNDDDNHCYDFGYQDLNM